MTSDHMKLSAFWFHLGTLVGSLDQHTKDLLTGYGVPVDALYKAAIDCARHAHREELRDGIRDVQREPTR